MPGPTGSDVPAEDAKLLVLARSVAARGHGSGAAVRDEMGRTYVAGPVSLRALSLSAVQVAVAAAVAAGAVTIEAVAVVGGAVAGGAVVGGAVAAGDADLLAELGSPTVPRG